MTTDLATVPEALRPIEPIAAHMVASTDGTRLHVREWGRRGAQPIVFVHGWSQCDLCWAPRRPHSRTCSRVPSVLEDRKSVV